MLALISQVQPLIEFVQFIWLDLCVFRRDRPLPTPLFSWPIEAACGAEPFSPVDSLGVGRVFHLDPCEGIRTRLRFADDAFEVLFTHKFKEARPAAV